MQLIIFRSRKSNFAYVFSPRKYENFSNEIYQNVLKFTHHKTIIYFFKEQKNLFQTYFCFYSLLPFLNEISLTVNVSKLQLIFFLLFCLAGISYKVKLSFNYLRLSIRSNGHDIQIYTVVLIFYEVSI